MASITKVMTAVVVLHAVEEEGPEVGARELHAIPHVAVAALCAACAGSDPDTRLVATAGVVVNGGPAAG